MSEHQYSIGRFAALNKITPRILRHYDKLGLLKPSAILENDTHVATPANYVTQIFIRLTP